MISTEARIYAVREISAGSHISSLAKDKSQKVRSEMQTVEFRCSDIHDIQHEWIERGEDQHDQRQDAM